MNRIFYKNICIYYTLRYTNRKKSIGFRITGKNHVQINSPLGYDRDHIERLLLKKGEWVLRNLPGEKKSEYFFGGKVLYLGETHTICQTGHPGRMEKSIHLPASSGSIKNALIKFYKNEARRIIEQRVNHWAQIMGVSPHKVLIKDSRSILGSCTPKRTLNFTYRIVMAPREIIDYVVVHELVHLRFMNHSKTFGKMVSRYIDDVARKKKWLREHASLLHL